MTASSPTARQRREDAFATARVAAVVAPMPALAFSASAATGARVPSVRELFGDRVTQVPSPDLRPERSRSFDASIVTRGRAGELRGSAELRGFVLFIDDLISYRRTSQFAYRAENVHSARVLGGELGLQGSYGRHLWVTSAMTAMHSRNQFDKALPLRPPLQVNVRPELALFPGFADRMTVYIEAEHTGFMYLDAANRTFVDERTILSAGVTLSLLRDRLLLSARAQNVLDDQATDMLSRPLPGRQIFVSIAAQEWL
jgi:iron complex outermembrane receptor protein